MITAAQLDAAPVGSRVVNSFTGVVIAKFPYGWAYDDDYDDEPVVFDAFSEDHIREGDALFLGEVAS